MVLPQPDSPTRPSVSPLFRVEGYAVYGFYAAYLVFQQDARVSGKCLTRSRTSRTGSGISGHRSSA